MANTDIPQNEEDLSLETTVSEVERPIWEWEIGDILENPQYSISELDELDSWLWDDITKLLNYENNDIWIEELKMMKNIVLWRLDRLEIDADKIIWENWVTLQRCFTDIENPN